MDPKDILAAEETLTRIETICRRHFSDENERSECYIYVIDSLKADDYKRLRAYSGKSGIGTFVYTITNRLIIDFKRMKYGRRRVPAKILELGKWAEAVYKYVCWEKFSFDDAYDFISTEGLFKGSYEAYLEMIPPVQKAPCPNNIYFISGNEADSTFNSKSTDAGNPLDSLLKKLERHEKETAVLMIRELLDNLVPEEKLLVKLVYQSDVSIPKASKIIGITPAKTRKKLNKIRIQFQEKLLAKGIRKS